MPQCNEVDVLINNRRVSELPESVRTEDEELNVLEHWFHSWRPIVKEDVEVTTACFCVIDNSDIRDFREEVAAIPGVSAVLVETGANDERHITTFVTELSDTIEERVYRA